MSDLDDVIGLLERWRDATGMARLRIGVDASRVIAALPPARKRELAIEVAERVAPQLVPAIRADDGDLTAEQVGALVDLLRRADHQQLDDLVTALRTGEVDEALDLVQDAVDVVAPPPPAEPASPATDEPFVEEVGVQAESPPAEDAVQDESSTGAVAAAMAVADEVEVGADGEITLDEDAVRARIEREAAARADRWRDTSRDVPATPSYRAPAVDFTTDLELPDPTVPSSEPVRALHDDQQRRNRMVAELGSRPVAAVVAAVTATPDGYRRRRAALAAIRDERIEADDLAVVVRSFSRPTDRAWVAGAALDAGLVGVTALPQLGLSPGAEARLRRRVP